MNSHFIKFTEQNNTGIIKLNRPDALNALNSEMAVNFLEILSKWKTSHYIKRVLLLGEGKAFCAGGDVKNLFSSSNKNTHKETFFQKEYTLNYNINEFPKDYLSVWNGLVMGGGVGLSIYGNYRFATEKAKFAMPETAIGFFPDVGGSYFLSQLKNGIGTYLGLTGKVLNVRDMIDLGIATHYIPSEGLSKTIDEYIKKGNINSSSYYPEMSSDITENKNFIEDTFQNDLSEIMKKLKNSKEEFGQKIYHHLLSRCPMSLAVSIKLINNAKSKSLKECLEIEYQLSQHMVYRNDFNNGVDSVLVSKNNRPQWSPSTIEEINYDEVNKMFEPHVKKLYL